jgi:hypothetical protein
MLVVYHHSVQQRSRAKSEARKTVFSLAVHGVRLDMKVGIIIFFGGQGRGALYFHIKATQGGLL